jgi:anion-transporting  ArsA/GET3 family ATPase
MEDYVVSQIKVKKLYEMVFKNRVMAPFVDGIPGLHDAIQMGKVFDLDRERSPSGRKAWDLVIVDAPATGHGLTMLGAPRSMMELTRSGPLHDAVKLLHDVFDDAAVTGLVLVTLPEDMPVSETLELHQRLGATRRQVLGCVLNEWWPSAELPVEEARRLDLSALPAAEAARQALLQQAARQERQELQRARLAAGLGSAVTPLPFLFRRNLGAADLAALGQQLLAGGGA